MRFEVSWIWSRIEFMPPMVFCSSPLITSSAFSDLLRVPAAGFAALTAIFAKVGVEKVAPDLVVVDDLVDFVVARVRDFFNV